MKTNNQLRRSGNVNNAVMTIKHMATSPQMVARFQDVLGDKDKAAQFLASVVSAVNRNNKLQECDPQSVMASAMVAATLNLDINGSLGFAAIVPYKGMAQFQIMTKGLVQLALRSGQYRTINVVEIFQDELVHQDIITGEIELKPVADGDRAHGRTDNVAGYVAYMELINGFRKMVYWSSEKILNHAKRFSKSWDGEKQRFYPFSAWADHYEAMSKKTVLKNMLSSWGILSTQMQTAMVEDGGFKSGLGEEITYPSDAPQIEDNMEESSIQDGQNESEPDDLPDETLGDDPELDDIWNN